MQDDERERELFGIFKELFIELVEKRAIAVRLCDPSKHEPTGHFLIENPRNPTDVMYMSKFGTIFHYDKKTGRIRSLHSQEAPMQRRLKIILDTFQIG